MSYPSGYRGYDVDGVLVGPYYGNGPIVPEKPYCIITGNTLANWGFVVETCGTQAPIYMYPGNVDARDNDLRACEWKSEMVGKLELIEFYEDREIQARYIKDHNPSCKVFLIRGTDVEEVL